MDNHALAPLTLCHTKAGLAVGTTTTLTQTLAGGATSNIYSIMGKTYSAAALSNTATPTTDWATGNAFLAVQPNQGCVFMVGFDHSGNLRAIQGQVNALDVNGNFLLAPQFGALGPSGSGSTDSDFCPIGYVVVKNGSAASAWTFGASYFAGPPTGVTFAFQDVCGVTGRPQIS